MIPNVADWGGSVGETKPRPKHSDKTVLNLLHLADVVELVRRPDNRPILQEGAHQRLEKYDQGAGRAEIPG